MGAFSGMKDAKRGFNSNPLLPGRYLVRIDECAFFDTDKNGEMWKNTLTILAVDEGEHKVGEVVNTFFKTKPGKKIFQQNVKSFIGTIMECSDEDIDEDYTKEACSEESPLLGLCTVVTARQRPSKSATDDEGNPYLYTTYSWSPQVSAEDVKSSMEPADFKRIFPKGLK
jgi:hypothetical protein